MNFVRLAAIAGCLLGLTAAGLALPRPNQLLPAPAQEVDWQIEQELRVDLNADKRPDAVLVMYDPAGSTVGATRARRLVLLLGEPGGRWRSIGASARLLDENYGPPELTCAGGVLNVQQEGGSRYKIFLTQRFRYESTSQRLRFIGEEREIVDGSPRGEDGKDGFHASYSTNLLTGQQQVSVTGRDDDEKPAYNVEQRRQLRLRPLYLEDVDNAHLPSSSLPWLPDFEKL